MTNTYLKDNEAKAEYDEGFKDGWNEAIDEAVTTLSKVCVVDNKFLQEEIRKLKK